VRAGAKLHRGEEIGTRVDVASDGSGTGDAELDGACRPVSLRRPLTEARCERGVGRRGVERGARTGEVGQERDRVLRGFAEHRGQQLGPERGQIGGERADRGGVLACDAGAVPQRRVQAGIRLVRDDDGAQSAEQGGRSGVVGDGDDRRDVGRGECGVHRVRGHGEREVGAAVAGDVGEPRLRERQRLHRYDECPRAHDLILLEA